MDKRCPCSAPLQALVVPGSRDAPVTPGEYFKQPGSHQETYCIVESWRLRGTWSPLSEDVHLDFSQVAALEGSRKLRKASEPKKTL